VARSVKNTLNANLMVESGLQSAVMKLSSAIPTGTAATNGFITWSYSSNSNSFAPFFVGILPNPVSTNLSVTNTTWLFSSVKNFAEATNAAGFGPDHVLSALPDSIANMNRGGAIDGSSTVYPAQWIYVEANEQRVGRFAFWIDDESAKIDINSYGNANNTKGPGLDSGDLFIPNTLPSELQALADYRNKNTFLSGASVRQLVPSLPQSLISYTLDNRTNKEAFIHYGPFYGQRRFNLNSIASTSTSKQESAALLQTILQNASPAYVNRKNSVPGTLSRIAASIVDYISPNPYPTLSPSLDTHFADIDNLVSPWPDYNNPDSWSGSSASPKINEFLVYYGTASQDGFSRTGNGPYDYIVGISRFIELWNLNDKSVTFPNLYLRIFNQQRIPLFLSTGAAGIPDKSAQTIVLSAAPVTFTANEFRTFEVHESVIFGSSTEYQWANTTANNPQNLRRLLPSVSNLGVLLYSSTPDGNKVLDGFYPIRLQATPAQSRAGTSPGYSGSGDTTDTRVNLGRFLSQWAPVTGTAHSHSPARANNSSPSRLYQNANNWFDRPQVGGAQNVSPTSAPAWIAGAPMGSAAELGNIFDPSNDLIDSGGRPRGGKTLVVGRFDPFHSFTNGSQMSVMNNRTNYIQKSDSVLLDIFSIGSTNFSKVNINSPRPISASPHPIQVATSLLDSHTLVSYPRVAASSPTIGSNLVLPRVIARLSHTNSWTNARPIRNFADLTLLEADPMITTFAQNNFLWDNRNILYPNAPVPTSVIAAGITQINGNDRSREEPFSRIANFFQFASFRYSVFVQGQSLDPRSGLPNSTKSARYIIDIIPEVTKAGFGQPTTSCIYKYHITKIE
jgi:hypothetical protein